MVQLGLARLGLLFYIFQAVEPISLNYAWSLSRKSHDAKSRKQNKSTKIYNFTRQLRVQRETPLYMRLTYRSATLQASELPSASFRWIINQLSCIDTGFRVVQKFIHRSWHILLKFPPNSRVFWRFSTNCTRSIPESSHFGRIQIYFWLCQSSSSGTSASGNRNEPFLA